MLHAEECFADELSFDASSFLSLIIIKKNEESDQKWNDNDENEINDEHTNDENDEELNESRSKRARHHWYENFSFFN